MSLKTQIIVVSCLFVVFAVLSMMSRMRLRRPPRRKKHMRQLQNSQASRTAEPASVDLDEQNPPGDVPASGKGVLLAAVLVAMAALALVLVYD